LRDLLVNENFSEGILSLHLTRDPTIKEKPKSQRDSQDQDDANEVLDIDDDTYMRFSLTKNNIADYGLSFFFEVLKDLVLSKEYIEALYKVIIRVARRRPKPIIPAPEMAGPDADGNEPTEEQK
jgi:hypothetical protein